jgi:hypothetical protein
MPKDARMEKNRKGGFFMATTERHAREILQKQYDRQNEFVKNAYDRIAFFVPKGMKERIKETAKSKGYTSVNSYVNALIAADMASTAEPL